VLFQGGNGTKMGLFFFLFVSFHFLGFLFRVLTCCFGANYEAGPMTSTDCPRAGFRPCLSVFFFLLTLLNQKNVKDRRSDCCSFLLAPLYKEKDTNIHNERDLTS
jgi:hypothetical protein